MTCERCSDIHIGQLKGLNSKPCSCLCHISINNRKQKHHLFGDWYCQTCKAYHRRNQICSM